MSANTTQSRSGGQSVKRGSTDFEPKGRLFPKSVRRSFPAPRNQRSTAIMPDNVLDQGPADAATSDSSAARLKSFIERVERLEEEKAGIANDIKEVYAEAKGTGFDVKIMRQIVRLRKMEQADRAEQEELLDLYMRALGMTV
jgi:uncharacterized protein (UPF0335 family)